MTGETPKIGVEHTNKLPTSADEKLNEKLSLLKLDVESAAKTVFEAPKTPADTLEKKDFTKGAIHPKSDFMEKEITNVTTPPSA